MIPQNLIFRYHMHKGEYVFAYKKTRRSGSKFVRIKSQKKAIRRAACHLRRLWGGGEVHQGQVNHIGNSIGRSSGVGGRGADRQRKMVFSWFKTTG